MELSSLVNRLGSTLSTSVLNFKLIALIVYVTVPSQDLEFPVPYVISLFVFNDFEVEGVRVHFPKTIKGIRLKLGILG
jgi:hypothetical protein